MVNCSCSGSTSRNGRLKALFGGVVLTKITTKLVEEYRDHRRHQPFHSREGLHTQGRYVIANLSVSVF
jgi:hypothetical protein